jgi:hypothetical protein
VTLSKRFQFPIGIPPVHSKLAGQKGREPSILEE